MDCNRCGEGRVQHYPALSRNTESAQSSIERKSSNMRAIAVLSGCAVTCG